jgi:hypothetical protein
MGLGSRIRKKNLFRIRVQGQKDPGSGSATLISSNGICWASLNRAERAEQRGHPDGGEAEGRTGRQGAEPSHSGGKSSFNLSTYQV